jgi:hypothetical protein
MTDAAVTDNAERERYEIHVDGSLAGFAEYRGHTDTRTFTHTEVDERYEGQGIGGRLVHDALEDAREKGLKVIPMCPFVKAYMGRHPEFLDLVDPPIRAAFGL